MTTSVKKPTSKILFLRGVSSVGCEKDTDKFNRLLLSDVTPDVRETVVYDTLPANFTGLDTWPTSTNLKCKWCTCNITGRPVFIPGKRLNDIAVRAFCTFNCAKAELDNNRDYEAIRWESGAQLKELYRIFNGRRITNIVAASSKSEMKEYGGTKSRAQFVKQLRDLSALDG